MKRIYMVLALAAMAVVAGCDSLKEETLAVGDGTEICFTTNISNFATKGGFEGGDAIGVHALDRVNVRYSVSGSSLVSDDPIFWPKSWSGSDTVCVSAYYPYDADLGSQPSLRVSQDQRDKADYRRSDVLNAWTMARYNAPVHLEFEHECSRVDIMIPESIRANVSSVGLSGVYSILEYEGPVYVGLGTILACDTVNEDGEKVYSLILVPQKSSPSLTIVLKNGQESSYEFGNQMEFEAGCRYKASLLVGDDGGLKVEWSTRIFDWQLGDSVNFDSANEQWGLCGPFCSYDPASAYAMTYADPGRYMLYSSLSDGSQLVFRFILDKSWGFYLGAKEHSAIYANLTDPVMFGQKLELVEGGSYICVQKQGDFRVRLNSIEKTFVLVPAVLYLYYHKGNVRGSFRLDYDGDSVFSGALEIPDGCLLYFGGSSVFGSSSSDAILTGVPEFGGEAVDSLAVKTLTPGKSMPFTDVETSNPIQFYFETGGQVDVAVDFDLGTVTFTRKEEV